MSFAVAGFQLFCAQKSSQIFHLFPLIELADIATLRRWEDSSVQNSSTYPAAPVTMAFFPSRRPMLNVQDVRLKM
jgi:hypothetical protein